MYRGMSEQIVIVNIEAFIHLPVKCGTILPFGHPLHTKLEL